MENKDPSAGRSILDRFGDGGWKLVVSMNEQVVVPALVAEVTAELGAWVERNLGGRTYLTSSVAAEDNFTRRRSSAGKSSSGSGAQAPSCRADDCMTDSTNTKPYHRKHRVCEFHAEAAIVIVAGLIQRFCRQCRRFDLLADFDDNKYSCRKGLEDHWHYQRKRKSQGASAE